MTQPKPTHLRAQRLSSLLFDAARQCDATPMEMVTACIHVALATSVYAVKSDSKAQHRAEVLSTVARIYDLEIARSGYRRGKP